MNILSQKRLSNRIWFLFLFTTSILVLQGVYNIFSLNKVDSSITTVYSSINHMRETANQIIFPISELRQLSMSLVMAPNKIYKKKYKESILAYQNRIDAEFNKLMSLELLDSKSKEILQQIRLVWAEYSKEVEKTYTYDDKGERIAVFMSVMTNEKDAYDKVMAGFKTFNTYQHKKGLEIYEKAQQNSVWAFWTVVVTTAIEALLLKFILAYVLRLITAYVNGKKEHERELVRINQEIEGSKIKAEAANKAKSEFLANMSHEIRTPMNAVLGFSEVLESLETDPDKLRYLDNVRTSGRALLNLINQVLDFSKIEAGKMELQYSAVSVAALFREMNTIFGQKILEKGLQFELTCERSVPAALILDEVRLRQVLINLVGNAVKFTETGKICVRASATECASRSTSLVDLTIVVEDTGIGVPDAQKDLIFGAFEQADGQKTAVYGGTGLGLAITHQLVTMMQGEIKEEGQGGHGAIFRVKLSKVEIAALESLDAREDDTLDVQTVCFEPATILIVDDIDYNREMLTVYLAQLNFSFRHAVNGQEAIEQARRHHPNIILMDMKMPVMDGYEASRHLKADEVLKTIPIIAVTASALERDEARIAELCDGYLRKPLSRVTMVRALMRYLPHRMNKAESGTMGKTSQGLMVNPSGEVMQKLYHLAMVGDMRELSQFAQTLIAMDESLGPFVRKLQQMAAKFRDSDILMMLEESMQDEA